MTPGMIAPVMTNRRFHIRAAEPQDGETVARLCAALSAHEGAAAPAFGPEDFRRLGFGPQALFSGLIAEQDGKPVGYALHMRDYDTDRLERCVHVLDLFVENTARGRGIGRALMAAAAAAGKAYGAKLAYWGVLQSNSLARGFYRSIGGVENTEMSLWGVDSEGFDRLCRRSLPDGIAIREGVLQDVPILTRFLEALFEDMKEPPPPEIGPRLARDGADGRGRAPRPPARVVRALVARLQIERGRAALLRALRERGSRRALLHDGRRGLRAAGGIGAGPAVMSGGSGTDHGR
jgi:GNAT superfamily N-acetyltransferase